jgi:hypothetical protein
MAEVAEAKGVTPVEVRKVSIVEVKNLLESQGMRLERKRFSRVDFRDYLKLLDPPELAQKYLALYDANPFHREVCAGAKHHHWWKGGLEDHLREMIGLGFDLMELYPGDFTFTKTDLIIAIFLHDFHKIWDYRYLTAEDRERDKRILDKQVFTTLKHTPLVDKASKTLLEIGKYGIVPTETQWSAVLFAEGGFSDGHFRFGGTTRLGDYVNAKNPLAAFAHVCDLYSAQILGRSIFQW